MMPLTCRNSLPRQQIVIKRAASFSFSRYDTLSAMCWAESGIDQTAAVAAAEPSLETKRLNMRNRRRRNKRLYPTVFALFFTAVMVFLFVSLCLYHNSTTRFSIVRQVQRTRILKSSCNTQSYEQCSCDDIYTISDFATNACTFAKSCDGGEGIGFFDRFFCTQFLQDAIVIKAALVLPLLCIYLALLFRMLASTAEDFFSPALEMLCHKMHLPPRFAGVTLLALGNGAADVSSTVTSISANVMDATASFTADPDASPGYQLSLGGLTGSGMMISTVVLGYVIYTARGISCRGAFVRDVSVYLITNLLLYYHLHPHPIFTYFSASAAVTPATINTFTIRFWVIFYFAFVAIVLMADIYHRTVVLPRWKSKSEALEKQRQHKEEQDAKERIGQAMDTMAHVHTEPPSSQPQPSIVKNPSSLPDRAINAILKAMSSYDDDDKSVVMNQPKQRLESPTSLSSTLTRQATLQADGSGWGYAVDGRDLEIERPVILRGNSGVLTRHPHPHPTRTTYSFSSATSFGSQQQLDQMSHHSNDHIYTSSYDPNIPPQSNPKYYNIPGSEEPTTYFVPMMIDGTPSFDQSAHHINIIDFPLCTAVEYQGRGQTSYNWWGSFVDGKNELVEHFKEIWSDIFEDDDDEAITDSSPSKSSLPMTFSTFLSSLDKLLLILEYPVTALRKLTIPIPCDGSYCKSLVALSVALSPIWIGLYMLLSWSKNLFWNGGVPYIEIASLFSFAVGILFLRAAPATDGALSLLVSVPISIFGFMVAATWIDTIAECLIELLSFLGVLLRIPNTIMGVTILAVGNSMSDLSANVTMAKKGFPNMAITACFAGPVFNVLIGLSLGFSELLRKAGVDSVEISLNDPINVGFIFLITNCVVVLFFGLIWNKGSLPSSYMYISFTIYGMYIITCLCV